MKIDVHAHIVDRTYLEALTGLMGLTTSQGGVGQTLLRHGRSTVAWFRDDFFDPGARIRQMDSQGVDLRILSLSSPGVTEWPAAEQAAIARRVNDAVASICRAHPDRFRGLASLPMGDPAASLAEMERALGLPGMVGLAVGSHVGGMPLNDPSLEPLWAAIDTGRVPVVEHPMTPLGAGHMDEFELPLRVGFVYETTTALARMIYGGVFERYPNFPFVVAHTGGALLTVLERLDNGYRLFPDCRQHISRLPSEYAKALYYDTCSFYAPTIMQAHAILGADRLLWGADDPFIGADTAHVDSLPLPAEERAQILGGNAARLFGIAPR